MPRHRTALTPRQARFVDEYLKDLNGSAAMVRSGYLGTRPGQAASRMLRRAAVEAAIADRKAEFARKARVSAESVVAELARIAFSDPRKLYDETGELRPVHEWDDDSAAAIAAIEVEQLFEGRGAERELVGHVVKVKRWDKVKALELLARHLGMLTDNLTLKVAGAVSIYLPSNSRDPPGPAAVRRGESSKN